MFPLRPAISALFCLLLSGLGSAQIPTETIHWTTAPGENPVESSGSYERAERKGEYWEGLVEDGADPMVFLKPTDLNADRMKFVYLKMAAQDAGSLQLFFSSKIPGDYNEDESVKKVQLPHTDEVHTYRLDLSNLEEWQGPVRSLRLDLDSVSEGSWVRVYAIGFSEKRVEGPEIEGLDVDFLGITAHVRQSEPLTPEEELRSFNLPPGFEAQLVACEPDIQKPMNLNFDARGRLWVTGTVEYPYPVSVTAETSPRDTVRILEDFDPNGKARKVTTFAENLNIPIGVMPTEDGAIVWSIPYVYRLYDRNGDDREDDREVLFGPFEYVDTHGNISNFNRGLDGWIYANHGYRNQSKIQGKDGHEVEMTSGHTWRFKPDGSRCEIFAIGQVNPFGITFDPLGNLYTADCHSKPIYQLLRGATYPRFSETVSSDGLGFGPEVCPHSHGSTAISGIAYYDADQFPKQFLDTIFIGNVVTNRINHDRIVREGGTFKAEMQPDFLVSEDPWFRPVNIKLGPDGALYIADFYNRIIGHYEVPLEHPGRDRERGRIWRIVYRGEGLASAPAPVERVRSDQDLGEWIADLDSPNLPNRYEATEQLVRRGGSGTISALTAALRNGKATANLKVHALWVLHRLDALPGDLLAKCAHDPSRTVRSHVFRILEDNKEPAREEVRLAQDGLSDNDPFVRRCAAGALQAHPDPNNLFPLLDSIRTTSDKDLMLRHVLRMAARDQLQRKATWEALFASPHFHYYQRMLPDIALGSKTDSAASFLLASLSRLSPSEEVLPRYAGHISRFGNSEDMQDLHRLLFERHGKSENLEFSLLESLSRGLAAGGKEVPAEVSTWAEQVAKLHLNSACEETVERSLGLVRGYHIETVLHTVSAMTENAGLSTEIRLAAAATLMDLDASGRSDQVGALLSDGAEAMELRREIAQLFGKYSNSQTLESLASTLETASTELAQEIAQALAASGEGAEALLERIEKGKASRRLLRDRQVAERLASRGEKALDARVEELTSGLMTVEQEVARAISDRRRVFAEGAASPDRGHEVFSKACAVCHRIGEVGNRVGPELDGVGVRGIDRLLEDVLDPNRVVDPAYRTTILELESGETFIGLSKGEEGETLLLADSLGEIHRIPRAEIQKQRSSLLSPMPTNIALDLGEEDFRDLLGYLLTQQPTETP